MNICYKQLLIILNIPILAAGLLFLSVTLSADSGVMSVDINSLQSLRYCCKTVTSKSLGTHDDNYVGLVGLMNGSTGPSEFHAVSARSVSKRKRESVSATSNAVKPKRQVLCSSAQSIRQHPLSSSAIGAPFLCCIMYSTAA